MKLNCKITPDDYIAAQYLHLRPRKVFMWVGLLVILAGLALSIQQLFFSASERIRLTPFAILIGFSYLAVIYWFILPLKTKKIYRQQKTLQEPYESELTDDAYKAVSAHGSINMPWTDFHKYKIGKNIILVYHSDAMYHMFAKRWFTNEQYEHFKAILQERLGRPKI